MNEDSDRRSDSDRHAAGHLELNFRDIGEIAHVDDEIERDISALAISGRTLFCACDETSSVERLVFDEEQQRFTDHESFRLGDVFELPGGADGEMDIEGLEIHGGDLWITGSHSRKRNCGAEGDSDLSGFQELERDLNRCFIGRLPLVESADGVLEPVATHEPMGGDERKAHCLRMDSESGETLLVRELEKDPLLGPTMSLPCKENGFDVEGLAASGERVWLGLRGPVIGKHALLVELRFKVTKSGWLKPRKLDGGRRYRLLALPLHGLAVRDLLVVDDDLFILAGATTDIESPHGVYRMAVPGEDGPAVFSENDIERVLDLPIVRGADHAEGLAVTSVFTKRQLVIAFDAPSESRVDPDNDRLVLDLHDLPAR